jgi:4'-phosphopantetheinyl transferase
MPFIFKSKIGTSTMLGVWQITETEESLMSKLRLSGEDSARLNDIRNVLRRKQWLACRVVVSDLAQDPQAQIRYTLEGKPFLADGSRRISISHSGEFAAVLVSSEFNVGIDIELLRDRIIRVADRFMTTAEREQAADPCRLEKLYVHWCSKESLYKFYGGFIHDMQHQIVLEPFDYLCSGSGKATAVVTLDQAVKRHELAWFTTSDWILAYTIGPERTS